MNVIFLDFDGVINTPIWSVKNGELSCDYNHPSDGTVNNFQAVQWVSEFCEKYNYHIVVSSTWRIGDFDLAKCLYDSGLRRRIKVIGVTPRLYTSRGDEITEWLELNQHVKNYLIFDDDNDMTKHMHRLVKCNQAVGFTMDSYNHAVSLHKAFNSKGD